MDGKPLVATAPDDTTVVVKFPAKFGPGVRLLDNLPIMSHARLEAALAAGTFAKAWDPTTPPSEMCGLGPFVVREYVPGVRVVFERNPHYWRTDAAGRKLPYLDRLTLEIVPDQNAELLRLQTGQIDCTQSETRPEDYTTLKRIEAQGKIRLIDLGVGLDADSLWFNLKKDGRKADPRWPWMQSVAFRKAVSHAVDRAAFADTVFLGAGVPVHGPVSPANKLWYSDAVTGEAYDQAQARTLLAGLGLADRNGDDVLEDRARRPVRFTLLTQKGNSALERGAAVIRTSLEAGRHQGGRGAARGGGARRSHRQVRRLRRDLLPLPDDGHGPGAEPGLLAQFGRRARVEPRAGEAGHRLGTRARPPDQRAGRDAGPGGAQAGRSTRCRRCSPTSCR